MNSYSNIILYSVVISNCFYISYGGIIQANDIVKLADKDGDGRINEAELYDLYKKPLFGRLNEMIKADFRGLDLNGDDFLTAEEIYPAPPRLSGTAIKNAPEIVATIDEDEDGRLDEKEALNYIAEKVPGIKLSSGTKKVEIKMLDKNNDGYLTVEEIQFDLSKYVRKGKDTISQFDKDGDGRLDEAEAYRYLRKVVLTQFNETNEYNIKRYDSNRDGFLTAQEIDNPPALDSVFGNTDRDMDGQLNEKEWLDYLTNEVPLHLSDLAKKAEFKSFDKNHDRYVSPQEAANGP